MDRLRTGLARAEEALPGFRTEIVEGRAESESASRGIANYLILDPLQGHAVTLWNPGPDGYLGRDTLPYGPDLTLDSPLGKLTVPTAQLPVDPKAPHRS